jgi:MerR family transcriptional regulator, thiopeptide resistance regulator
MFTVGELSKLTGVTVRTLHHYDEIGLVRPSARTAAGYRLYDDDDVLRLQQVLLFRELGLPLPEIAAVLDDPEYRRDDVLRRHREVLVAKRTRLDAMVAALDAALAQQQKGHAMKPEDVKSLFDGFDPAQYEAEAEERWGNTDAYKESQKRVKRYGKADWDAIKAEGDAIYRKLADLMAAGTSASDPTVQAAAEEHREHISKWFYPCSKEIHRGLGEMYIADPRFTANLDRYAPGFAQFLRDAFAASP